MRKPNQFQIYIRFLLFITWQFRWPLIVFWVLVLVCGLLLWRYHPEHVGFVEACYDVFLLIFLESPIPFPKETWFLQPIFFLLPVVGLGAIADSLIRLAFLLFTKKRNLQEWQRMVASVYRNHIVVVGAGKLGSRIVHDLVGLGEPVVAIERDTTTEFLEMVQDLNVPVIRGDGRQQKILEQAGVGKARSIILVTDDDLANLDAALTARDIHPAIQVVVKLFDDTLAVKVGGAFNMPAISTSHVSAPSFIAAATGRKVYHDFELGGHHLKLTDVEIKERGDLIGKSVGEIQASYSVNIVMYRGVKGVNVNPRHDVVLGRGDTVLVIAPHTALMQLQADNRDSLDD